MTTTTTDAQPFTGLSPAGDTTPGPFAHLSELPATERVAALHTELVAAVEHLASSQRFIDFCQALRRLSTYYSPTNVLLIYTQCEQASVINGFKGWLAHGRAVRKGEKAIKIFAPVTIKNRDEGTDADGYKLVGFRVAAVFDISQTDPLPGATNVLEPEGLPELLNGDDTQRILDRVQHLIEQQGFTFTRADCRPANGTTNYTTRTVTVRPDVSELQALKTGIHELAHVLLHEPTLLPEGSCRGRIEVEAETVASLVCALNNIDSSTYSIPYVTHWASTLVTDNQTLVEAVLSVAQRVTTTATRIHDQLTELVTV
jgi:antirestriction protein ArdC